MSECDREASITRGPWPTGGCCAMEKKRRIVWSIRGADIQFVILVLLITPRSFFQATHYASQLSIDQGKNISGVKFCDKSCFYVFRFSRWVLPK